MRGRVWRIQRRARVRFIVRFRTAPRNARSIRPSTPAAPRSGATHRPGNRPRTPRAQDASPSLRRAARLFRLGIGDAWIASATTRKRRTATIAKTRSQTRSEVIFACARNHSRRIATAQGRGPWRITQMSIVTSLSGRAQQISALPSSGRSSGSVVYCTDPLKTRLIQV